jgi:uncharacterized membrane-anchored protein
MIQEGSRMKSFRLDHPDDGVVRLPDEPAAEPANIVKVASLHRWMIRVALLLLGLWAIARVVSANLEHEPLGGLGPVVVVVMLGLVAGLIASLVCTYRVRRAMGTSRPAAILLAVFMMLPVVNFIALLVAISAATAWLKRSGVRVGGLGVPQHELERLAPAA